MPEGGSQNVKTKPIFAVHPAVYLEIASSHLGISYNIIVSKHSSVANVNVMRKLKVVLGRLSKTSDG